MRTQNLEANAEVCDLTLTWAVALKLNHVIEREKLGLGVSISRRPPKPFGGDYQKEAPHLGTPQVGACRQKRLICHQARVLPLPRGVEGAGISEFGLTIYWSLLYFFYLLFGSE